MTDESETPSRVPLALTKLSRHPVKDVLLSWLTLLVGTGALLGADFGISWWIQIPLYLWLLTVGLPTTLTVLTLATLWGRFPPLYGMGPFMLSVMVAAPIVQMVVMEKLLRHSAPAP